MEKRLHDASLSRSPELIKNPVAVALLLPPVLVVGSLSPFLKYSQGAESLLRRAHILPSIALESRLIGTRRLAVPPVYGENQSYRAENTATVGKNRVRLYVTSVLPHKSV